MRSRLGGLSSHTKGPTHCDPRRDSYIGIKVLPNTRGGTGQHAGLQSSLDPLGPGPDDHPNDPTSDVISFAFTIIMKDN